MSQATLPSRFAVSGDRAPALWRPVLLVVLLLSSLAHFRHRDADELWGSSGLDAQVKFQIATWFVAGLFALYFLWRGRADVTLLRRGPLFWYCGYVALALFSTVYSNAPAMSLFRAMQLAVAIVLIISMREHLEHIYFFACMYIAINWLFVILGIAGVQFGQLYGDIPATASLISEVGNPAWRFHSCFGHPSEISAVGATTVAGLAVRIHGRQWQTWGPVLACLVVTVVLTMSRTMIVSMLLGLCVAALYHRTFTLLLAWIGFATCLAAIPDKPRGTAARYLMRGQSAEELRTISGRTELFAEALERAEDAWVLGHGFRSGRRTTYRYANVTQSHNLVLEALTSLGIVGLLLIIMVPLSLVATACKLIGSGQTRDGPEPRRRGWELTAMLVPIFACCSVEGALAGSTGPSTLLFIAIIAYAGTALWSPQETAPPHKQLGGATAKLV